MVEGEFLEPDRQRTRQNTALDFILRYCQARVPFYQQSLADTPLPTSGDALGALPHLPILSKSALQEGERQLTTRRLPAGETLHSYAYSSGTTGRPVRVMMTARAALMFPLLSQRGYRWFRLAPDRKLAGIRAPNSLPRLPDGTQLQQGATLRLPRWLYVGPYFETGPYAAYSHMNPIERHLDWLRSERPDYLVSYPNVLEEYAFAAAEAAFPDSINAVMGISSWMTASMRARIEATFGLPVHQNYGLNEIGIVATRCDAGRYHVHAEHCVVEIVDAQGNPCAPGQTGRILVTGLLNLAMPLLRYDTDDLAEPADGPCPCGRTLPAFVAIAGRYRRWRMLPEGSRGRFHRIADCLQSMPAELVRGLRRYQVHLCRDGSFELRIVAARPMPAGFAEMLHATWDGAEARGVEFRIRTVDTIEPSQGGKVQEFSFDWVPTRSDDSHVLSA